MVDQRLDDLDKAYRMRQAGVIASNPRLAPVLHPHGGTDLTGTESCSKGQEPNCISTLACNEVLPRPLVVSLGLTGGPDSDSVRCEFESQFQP